MSFHPEIESAMTEKEFQAIVIDRATSAGFRVYHTHDSRRSPSGFPDVVICAIRATIHDEREPVLFMWELKSMKGTVPRDQREWIEDLSSTRIVDARIVRPSDIDYIDQRLVPARPGRRRDSRR